MLPQVLFWYCLHNLRQFKTDDCFIFYNIYAVYINVINIIKHIHIAQTYLINRLSLYIINLDEYTQSKRFY